MRKNRMQRMKKAAALALACAMLMGQTVWVLAEDAESDLKEQEGTGTEQQAQVIEDDIDNIQEQINMDDSDSVQEQADPDEGDGVSEAGIDTEGQGDVQELESAERTLQSSMGENGLCIGVGEEIGLGYEKNEEGEYTMQSEDSSICKVTGSEEFYDEETQKNMIIFNLIGVSEGETVITCFLNGDVVSSEPVTVTADIENDDDYDSELTNIYIGQPVMIDPYLDVIEDYYKVECEDEGICKAEFCTYEGSGSTCAYITVEGISEGQTLLSLIQGGNVVRTYGIRVQALPEDGVIFNDLSLRTQMIDDYDTNDDGYMSQDEMLAVTYFNAYHWGMYYANKITDLKGLEYALNLQILDLSGQVELSNIDVLFGLDSLRRVFLQYTKVSSIDRWKLADFHDQELSKGERITLPTYFGLFEPEEELSVEAISGEEYVAVTDYTVTAIKGGEARIRIQYQDLSTEITVTVKDFDVEQEVGEDYSVTVTNTNNQADNSSYPGADLIVDSNHTLWQTYPVAEKERINVKEYAANWVYYGSKDRAVTYAYVLDTNNILWDGSQKLAEDVVKFDGRYALNSKGTLKNIYNSGDEQIEEVQDWISPVAGDSGIVYILKTDGTLWKRQEVADGQQLNQLKLVDDDVLQLMKGKYLKKDGTVIQYAYGNEELDLDVKVSRMGDYDTYCDENGNCYVCYYSYVPDEESGIYGEYIECSEYANVGQIEVIQTYQDNGILYLLDKEGNVYQYDVQTKEKTVFLSGIEAMESAGFYDEAEGYWAFRSEDGAYYDRNGKIMSEVLVKSWEDFELKIYSDGTQVVERNEIPVLNCVMDIWEDDNNQQYFALRTDGTVWNITKVPVQILDLKETGYETGDLNGDDSVNLMDLMMCLNHVAKKSELTGDALVASDINGDGKVDLIDLMRILNYVSKKTTTL